jgi:hypothetical protein
VLHRLRELTLYGKAEKCGFGVLEVGFLGFATSGKGIAMESDRISKIEDWPTLESIRDIQVHLGSTHFYRRFIRKYAKVTTPISDLPKKVENSSMSRQAKWEWTRVDEFAFLKLKRAFTDVPIPTISTWQHQQNVF